MAPRSSLILLLVLLAHIGVGKSQDDSQPVRAPSSANASENHLSWQSAFWALLALALNTATQPCGQICGLPSEWGFVLRWSPVVCIINSLEALSCLRLHRRDSKLTLVVAPHKYDTGMDSSNSDVANLQRNTLVRIVAFILGPLLQAAKLYACQGIFWVQVLATIYLASFLCDELLLGLLWVAGSAGGRNRVTGLVEAVAGSLLRPPAHIPQLRLEAAADDQLRDSRTTLRQGLAIAASHLLLAWFVVETITGAYMTHFHAVMFSMLGTAFLGSIASGIFCGLRSHKKQQKAAQVFMDILFGIGNVLWVTGIVIAIGEKCQELAVIEENGIIHFNTNGSRNRWAWKIGLVLWTLEISRWARNHLTTSNRYGIPKPVDIILPLWAGAHVVVALAMFRFAYDPSRTYKPAWTDVLG
ncbi:hypothetical protein CORC01_13223 [Colletotrichum orchidophilum]|uniref:Integral membrane protein n=1 Tax=Colletotrichum orchidophilum TaxID=1209926 RepID=A0A1G4AQP3_9PEZI|nr:uncharacterized protein CORC01_13223 [Colletotrichum orchidophilum]OHE91490.1 hypothetical protein CORC01_13223 [Colletotrichum orchidophilum]